MLSSLFEVAYEGYNLPIGIVSMILHEKEIKNTLYEEKRVIGEIVNSTNEQNELNIQLRVSD